MTLALPEIVLKNLQSEGLLRDGRRARVVIGFSGGLDSTVLLHALAAVRETHPLTITAAYVDHGWRDSILDELALLHRHCARLQTPLVIIPADRRRPKTEAAAREARYDALCRLARDVKAHALLTAHQADDQIETLLFRLFRGSGLDGLVGVQKRLSLFAEWGAPPTLRPMLDVSREAVRQFAESRHLDYFRDPTNSQTRFQRNLIRQEVLPFLRERFGQIDDALLRLREVSESDAAILRDAVDAVWARAFSPEDGGSLDATAFNQLARPYQRRVIKRFLAYHHLEPDFHRIEDVIDFIEGENRRNLNSALMSLEKSAEQPSSDARFLSVYKRRVSVVSDHRPGRGRDPVSDSSDGADAENAPDEVCVAVLGPGAYCAPSLGLVIRIVELSEQERATQGLLRPEQSLDVCVDFTRFSQRPLTLRTRQPGDRIRPFGMSREMRLKNYFINRGVPRFERDRTPLLADGQDILWVAGVGVSEALRVQDRPTHRLSVERAPAAEPAVEAEPSV